MGARMAVMADREANWSRRGCAQAHGLRAALRLRARHRRAAHAYRHRSASRPPISWPRVRRDARGSGRAASRCRRSRSIRSTSRSTTRPNSARMVETVAKHGGVLGGLTFLGEPLEAEDRRGARQGVRGRKGERPRSRFPCRRKRFTRTRARSGGSPTPRCATSSQGRIVAGHCCSLALADDDERAATIAKVAEAGIAVVSLPMCNMYLQDRAGRPHAALARRRAAARARRRRRHRDGRERQHARSVLRLWRPRHAGGLSRGDAHPALRPFGAAVAEDRRGDAGRGDAAAERPHGGRRACRPRAHARADDQRAVVAAADTIAWCCMRASRSTARCRIIGNWIEARGRASRHATPAGSARTAPRRAAAR